MARSSHQFHKRQKELARKKKKELKRQRKLDKKVTSAEENETQSLGQEDSPDAVLPDKQEE